MITPLYKVTPTFILIIPGIDKVFISSDMAAAEWGVSLNTWRYPDDVFGPGEEMLKLKLKTQIGRYEFPLQEWKKACFVADDVLRIILTELRNQANKNFEGLVIDSDILRQGSARQGLKIAAPDEFDAVVLFQIEGLVLQEVRLADSFGQILPGQIRLRVMNDKELASMLPGLVKVGVFEMVQGICLINTKVFQEQVLKSLMDKSLTALAVVNQPTNVYNVTRASMPPTMQLTVHGSTSSPMPFKLNVDFVPALMLGREGISIPRSVVFSSDHLTLFPRFCVMKWINKENVDISTKDKEFIWRNSSSSYENCMFGLCLENPERQYIMTSCRVMKALVMQLKRRQNHAANLLTSYHLKTISMYCILLLTIPSVAPPGFHLSGVREALGYFLAILKSVLENEFLPHFFLGNEYLDRLFPGSSFTNIHVKYNLFSRINSRNVEAAKFGYPVLVQELDGCFENRNMNASVINTFENRVLRRK